MPRAMPVRSTPTPYTAAAAGRASERTPSLNQVERRSSVSRTAVPVNDTWPPFVRTWSVVTRFESLTSVRASTTREETPSRRASELPENLYGPQLCTVEQMVSYGSSTDTRYGTGREPGHASSTDAVRPPELAK